MHRSNLLSEVPTDREAGGRTVARFWVSVTAAVLLMTVGCSGPKACPAVGAFTGVGVNLTRLIDKLPGPADAQICIEGVCKSFASPTPLSRGIAWQEFVDDPGLEGRASVMVTVRFTDTKTAQ